MGEEVASALLGRQHRNIDEGIEGVAQGGDDIAGLARSLRALREHLYMEEAVLFPLLVQAEAGLALSVMVMKREHGQMWPLLTGLEAALAAGSAPDALRDPADRLLMRLKIHNPKEEQILYSAADRFQAGHPDQALELSGLEVPADWVCAMAPPGA